MTGQPGEQPIVDLDHVNETEIYFLIIHIRNMYQHGKS